MDRPSSELPSLRFLGDAALMQPQPEVPEGGWLDPGFRRQLEILEQCMHHYQGIGIAAPQIGWAARVFCLGIETRNPRYPGAGVFPFEYWINPSVEADGDDRNWAWEGCLSVPGMRGWVERPAAIIARGRGRDGVPKERRLCGFAARVFQHEFDHLDGILFPMRVSEPRFLLPERIMAERSGWQTDWPSPGASRTAPGELSEQI